MSRRDLVVLGGYGATGREVARALAGWFPGRVVVAGRDLARARELAWALPGAVRAIRVDVERPAEVAAAAGSAAVVVMCVERANPAVARTCVERGAHYVDICATSPVLARIEDLHGAAVARGTTVALSVGLAPGLTNVLAAACVRRLPDATGVDLTVLLGTAGDHGPDALRWLVEQLAAPRPGARRQRVELPGSGTRTAYPFGFSDQHALAASLGIPVTTRLCLDSAPLTGALFALRRAGLFTALRRLGADGPLVGAMARIGFGSDRWVVHAAATGAGGRRRWAAASGHGESAATARVAAHVAALLDTGTAPAGVHHLDRLVEPDAFLDRLRADGVALHGAVAVPA
ncbi:saccharopine dehydrogenase NADP-binding domain-containing protein [Pseudonocardia humida]|uniref:Saccharopine dehydrogenase NADP-binding domain-containing protein n=1 Tax=Pseudonocardia humida TaxID=2800819 RepID=A0ABT1A1C2_9PSEU|nr:saccharopine dehydrogenase NADP-binding domain-containing protein [Pseudonocardia humida]MCO1656806.1 saccharopine dehydrogenase NADP-binding domain-containing protein [Pseudonocardia humida]